MQYHHQILKYIFYPLKVVTNFGSKLGLAPSNSLRILNYHDTPIDQKGRFEDQLKWLSRWYKFVTPSQFGEMISGNYPVKGHNLLLTFDDGFLSNRTVAEEVLNPMKISALFFVVSDFVDIEDLQLSREFISKNIYDDIKTEEVPGGWKNMRWNDLEALLEQGHTIGAHTMTHAKLSSIKSEFLLKKEIVVSADKLSSHLGVAIDHFAYPYGDIGSFSIDAMAIAKRRFKFIYSGLRGDNLKEGSSFAICREGAATQNLANQEYSVFENPLLGSFLLGASDFHYSSSRDKLNLWDASCNSIKYKNNSN